MDYKSGRLGVTEEDVKGALAMSVYQLLAKRNSPDRRVFATIHALRGGVTASASYTDEEMLELEEDLRGVGITILEKDFEAVRPVPLPRVCPSCDFLPLCTRAWKREGRDYVAELAMDLGGRLRNFFPDAQRLQVIARLVIRGHQRAHLLGHVLLGQPLPLHGGVDEG